MHGQASLRSICGLFFSLFALTCLAPVATATSRPAPTPKPGPGGAGQPTGQAAPQTAEALDITIAGTPGALDAVAGAEAMADTAWDWTYWWNFNRDEVLVALRTGAPAEVGGGAASVFSRRAPRARIEHATRGAIREEILPQLRAILASDDEGARVRAAAALSLAKAGDTTQAGRFARLLRNDDDTVAQDVQEAAALALGVLGADLPIAWNALNAAAMRREGGRTRSFAIVALGLLGRSTGDEERATTFLLDLLTIDVMDDDTAAATLLTLGYLGHESAVDPLLHVVHPDMATTEPPSVPASARSFAIDALGRIGSAGATAGPDAVRRVITAQLFHFRADVNVRRSAVLALGRLGAVESDRAPQATANALRSAAEDDEDAAVRGFALLSIGRVIAEHALAERHEQRLWVTLRKQLSSGQPAEIVRPYAALALGLATALGGSEGRAEHAAAARRPLRAAWDSVSAVRPRVRGACAIGLGLARDTAATGDLLACEYRVDDLAGAEHLRGKVVMSLGLLGGNEARSEVVDALVGDRSRAVQLQAATAAAFGDDARAVEELLALFADTESRHLRGTVALALGRLGDRRAIVPLVSIVTADAVLPSDVEARLLAVRALGDVAAQGRPSVVRGFVAGFNYRAIGAAPSLYKLMTIR